MSVDWKDALCESSDDARARDLNYRKLLHEDWSLRQVGEGAWLSAAVPGCNFMDLLRNGVIEDPYHRDNVRSVQWVEQEDWEYRCVFFLDDRDLDRHAELVFEGLDTYASVSLNGTDVLHADNMFRTYRVRCRDFLRSGRNELTVVFRSPSKENLPRHRVDAFTYPAENDDSDERLSAYARKAPYHFGWDWAPRLVSCGVWRPVYLEFFELARITDVETSIVSLSDERAALRFRVEADICSGFSGQLTVGCDGHPDIGKTVDVQALPGQRSFAIDVEIAEPRRWWPNGLGDPYLYEFDVTLSCSAGRICRERRRVGLRTIEVVNEPDRHGMSFYLKVNDRPVFMKGANYVPPDSFLCQVTTSRYEQLFADVTAANMNMLRIWGGGVYESDVFYDLADEHGVLIWQDFMFANTFYPGDEDFLRSVSAEAVDAIRRLRNHPCIALWCGNNEIEMGISCWDWPDKFAYSAELFSQLKADYKALFHTRLPQLIAEHDPQRFYLPSTPIGFWERPEEDGKGNSHYWGVWHGNEGFSEYRRRISRFMSEFGFQSMPILESVERFTEPSDREISSPAMQAHQRNPKGDAKIRAGVRRHFRRPKSFEDFLYLTQVQQAEGLRIAFEAHRGAMPHCMGSLFWQLNDCWPSASWSSIDYYGRWKALHYQAKRSFEPVALSIVEIDGSVDISVASDKPGGRRCRLDVELLDFLGERLQHRTADVDVPANASTPLWSGERESLLNGHDASGVVLRATLSDAAAVESRSLHYFSPFRELALARPAISLDVERDGADHIVRLNTDALAKNIYLSVGAAKEVINFSDNFFDLIPGQETRVGFRSPEPVDVSAIRVRSLFDTYA